MKVYDVFYRFDTLLDKASSGAFPELLQKQREEFIDRAMNKYVVEMYTQGFEVAEVMTSKLKDFLFYDTLSPETDVVPFALLTPEFMSTSYKIPAKMWFSIYESVKLSTECGTKNVGIKAIRHDALTNMIRDPFNKPTDLDLLRVLVGNRIHVIHPVNSILGELNIGFIGKVTPLVENLTYSKQTWKTEDYWLQDTTIDDILSIAVSIALETFESPRLKSFIQIK